MVYFPLKHSWISWGLGWVDAIHPLRLYLEVSGDPRKSLLVDQNYILWKMVTEPIIVSNNFQEGFGHYTNHKTPHKSYKQLRKLKKTRLHMDWKLEGSKQPSNYSRAKYSIFLKENAYPNVDN